MRPLLGLLLLVSTASAQAPGVASFRVYEKGAAVGTIESRVERYQGGWRIRGASRIGGSVPVTIPNLDLIYDGRWTGRFMTLEMKAPDEAIVHVAVVGETTRTDIVRPKEARFRSNSVSPDTIFLPERAYAAYEAVAARLEGAFPGFDLPLFVAPLGETRALVESIERTTLPTGKGPLTATRYVLTEIRERPTRVELWAAGGRLLRLELPRAGISIVRTDVIR
jgi:hypothetical protein